MALFGIHPSVLITCVVSGSHDDRGNQLELSGSGFVLDAGNGLVATSAAWIVAEDLSKTPKEHFKPSVISVDPGSNPLPGSRGKKDSQQLQLSFPQQAQWHVFVQEYVSEGQNGGGGRGGRGSGGGVKCLEASVHRVCLMKSVYSCLEEQMASLSQWRLSPTGSLSDAGVKSGSGSGGLQSILLPLSSVVILQINMKYYSKLERAPVLSFPTLGPGVGDTVSVLATPLGSFCPEVFLASVSSGCVSKVLGSDGAVFITDARCLSGCEGAMVVHGVPKGISFLEVVGMVIAPLLTPTGSPTGLTMVCFSAAVLSAAGMVKDAMSTPAPLHAGTSLLDTSLAAALQVTVAVTSNGRWGTGMLVSPQLVLTCGHLLKGATASITVHLPRALQSTKHISYAGRIVFSNVLPDLALIKLTKAVTDPTTIAAIGTVFGGFYQEQSTGSFNLSHSRSQACQQTSMCGFKPSKSALRRTHPHQLLEGEPVYTVGYGLQDPSSNPSAEPLVTKGVVSKVVRQPGAWREVMVVTTAVVHPGMSGGMIVSAATGRPLGMIVSNSEDKETSVVYPDVNYNLPASWILPPVLKFSATGNYSELEDLCSSPQGVKELWQLRTHVRGLRKRPSKL